VSDIRGGVHVGISLTKLILQWFHELEAATSTQSAIVIFLIAGALLVVCLVRALMWLRPFAWPRIRRALKKSVSWQVQKVFEWAKWYGQRKDSVYWSVLCAWSVSISCGVWIRLPPLRPLLLFLIFFSLTTFGLLGWEERGPNCDIGRFLKSFYIPTFGASAVSVIGIIGLALWDYL
jgi:hypothetical protein